MRFYLLADHLMPEDCSSYPVVRSNYLWDYDSPKKTLKEFEKEVYYSNGDYKNAYTQSFNKRFLTGQMEIEKQIQRDGYGPGHYIRDGKGFRASSHISAPK